MVALSDHFQSRRRDVRGRIVGQYRRLGLERRLERRWRLGRLWGRKQRRRRSQRQLVSLRDKALGAHPGSASWERILGAQASLPAGFAAPATVGEFER